MSASKRYCSVPQCCTYGGNNIALHFFPQDKKLCTKWKVALKIGKPITKYMNVCGRHFLKSDYMPGNYLILMFQCYQLPNYYLYNNKVICVLRD